MKAPNPQSLQAPMVPNGPGALAATRVGWRAAAVAAAGVQGTTDQEISCDNFMYLAASMCGVYTGAELILIRQHQSSARRRQQRFAQHHMQASSTRNCTHHTPRFPTHNCAAMLLHQPGPTPMAARASPAFPVPPGPSMMAALRDEASGPAVHIAAARGPAVGRRLPPPLTPASLS